MEEAGWRTEQDRGGGRPPRRPLPTAARWPRYARTLIIFALALLLLFSLGSFATFYTDFLWFNHLGFRDMFVKRLSVRALVFVATFALAALILLGNWLAAQRQAARARTGAAPLPGLLAGRLLIIGVGLFLAFLLASAASGTWEEVLLYLNSEPFGIADPVFGRDVGFYIFDLPVFRFFHGWLMAALVLALLGLLPIYFAPHLPDLQRGSRGPLTDPRFRRHVALLGGVLLLVWSAGYILDMFGLLYSSTGVAYGANYTDIRAGLWALRLQLLFMALTALALFYNAFRSSPRLPLFTGALWLAATLIVGGLMPGILQRYVVEPNELTLETPYIESNIEFTRRAFNLDTIRTVDFGPVVDLSSEDLLDSEDILRNVRVWDYRPLQQTYQQLQGLRPYYAFQDVDIDRYTIDGRQRQVMLSARELDKNKLPAPSWVNRNLEFTHGYGIVMNPVNEATSDGRPSFFIRDFPPQSRVEIEVTRPEIYYGELTNDTVYVGSNREEFSYPSGDENVYTNYAGTGGVVLDSFWKRLAFSLRQSDPNVLLNDDITSATRVQYRRNVQDRIRALAPFLLLDSDPYLVVNSEGRLIWLQDAFTASDAYPYATPIRIATRASATTTAGEFPTPAPMVNYLRNSVKITVDAYDGTVAFYLSDPADPIINSYARAFPNMFRPLDDMPADLVAHLRYPEDLFATQARQYLTYHMTDIRIFYNKEDLWQIPTEIVSGSQTPSEPYYVTLPLPGSDTPEYLLILPFSPATKNNMIAWMAARNDPGAYGELVIYELPKQELIFGPGQIEGRIDQEPFISQQFSLWDQRGSNVIRGNLLVLPINQSFLYIEPIYLLSETSALPELKRIVTASNTSVAMAETLESSLRNLVSGAGVTLPVDDVETPAQPPTGELATIDALVAAANAHLVAAEEAQRQGDWAGYGRELAALRQILDELARLVESTN